MSKNKYSQNELIMRGKAKRIAIEIVGWVFVGLFIFSIMYAAVMANS
jgi:hypothetical protein